MATTFESEPESVVEDRLELHMTRVLRAPPPVVFRMLTEPGELAKWWGPRGFFSPSIDLDPRAGGTYRIEMQPPEGDSFFLAGKFREVDPPFRLTYTFRWEDPTPDDVGTLVTLTLRDLGGAAELSFTQGTFATEERRALHERGWSDTLDRLEDAIASPGDA